MSGKRVVILMAIGIIVTSSIMYALYFATRQLDYIPPGENSDDPPSPHAIVESSETRLVALDRS